MCAPGALMIASTAFQTVGAMQQAQAQRAALNYEAQVARNNATTAEYKAKDAISQGQREEQEKRLEMASLFGNQRATMAANGLDLGEGSPLDMLTTTKYMGERKALAERDKGRRQAWGYRIQGQNFRDDAAMGEATARSIKPLMVGATSLLGNAGSVSDSWNRAKKSGMSYDEWMWGVK